MASKCGSRSQHYPGSQSPQQAMYIWTHSFRVLVQTSQNHIASSFQHVCLLLIIKSLRAIATNTIPALPLIPHPLPVKMAVYKSASHPSTRSRNTTHKNRLHIRHPQPPPRPTPRRHAHPRRRLDHQRHSRRTRGANRMVKQPTRRRSENRNRRKS
jgi:hypothetical protein